MECLANSYIQKIRSRLNKQNKNWIAVICGATGTGKSYSAIGIGHLIAGKENSVHIVFNPIAFFELINSEKIKKGDVIIFDEAGVGINSREWQSVQSKIFGSVLQTFRNMNLAMIFTTPNLSFIDVMARKLIHCYMETVRIDYARRITWLKIYEVQVNSMYDKIYYKNPVLIQNGQRITIVRMSVREPEVSITEEYEFNKSEYTKKLNQNALNECKALEKKRKPKVTNDVNIIANEIKNKKELYTKTYKGRSYIDLHLIKNDFKVSLNEAKTIKKLVEAQ